MVIFRNALDGINFFELHVKFEELYREAQENVNLITDRHSYLGGFTCF